MTMDWMGMLVSILSLLVTILIGWQIYNVLQVEKKIHEGGKAGKRPALTGRSVFCRQKGPAFFVWTFRS